MIENFFCREPLSFLRADHCTIFVQNRALLKPPISYPAIELRALDTAAYTQISGSTLRGYCCSPPQSKQGIEDRLVRNCPICARLHNFGAKG
jgi:hypothetical protein